MDTFQYLSSTADLLTSSIHLATCFGLVQSLLSQIPGTGCCYAHCNKVQFKICVSILTTVNICYFT